MEEPHLEEYVRLEGVDRSHKVQRVHFQSPYHIVIEDELGMECQPDIEDLEKEAWARICQFCVLEKRRRLTPGINGISSYRSPVPLPTAQRENVAGVMRYRRGSPSPSCSSDTVSVY